MSRVGSKEFREVRSEAAPLIDARDFARAGGVLEGKLPIAGFQRLATLLSGNGGELRYRLHGTEDARGQMALELAFDTSVQVTCQRCLQQFALPLAGKNRFRLLEREPDWSAAEVEVEVAADGDDEIVAGAALDVQALLEDEVLLALPLAPRHVQCELAGGKIELKRESPFGVLAQLRKRAGR